MTRALLLALLIAASGCAAPHPFLQEGGPDWAVVKYSGDIAATLPLARHNCEQYQRVPKLTDHDLDTAYYACVRP
jgi:hypothetical protein